MICETSLSFCKEVDFTLLNFKLIVPTLDALKVIMLTLKLQLQFTHALSFSLGPGYLFAIPFLRKTKLKFPLSTMISNFERHSFMSRKINTL